MSKDNIVKSSFILFLKKGYKEVTIKNIMEATNLSKGAIYHHFSSKEEIYFATLETYYFELLKTDDSLFQSGNFKENIRLLYRIASDMFSSIENLTEEGMNYPIRNYYSFQLESEKNEIVRSKTMLAVFDFRKMIKNIVSKAIDKKQIKSDLDIEAVTFQIIGLLEGTAVHHSTFKDDVHSKLMERYDLVFDSYLDLICID